MDLFTHANRYPNEPGYQKTDTSRQAADAISFESASLQGMVLICLDKFGDLATFEIAAILKRSYRSIQPRTSELRAKGKIVDSGKRKTDPETGRDVIVWRLV